MNNISKCIGIISWLPSNEYRNIRKNKLEKLLLDCDNLFNLPVIVIAQNWDDSVKVTPNCIVHHYGKLGITGARKKLREVFLTSPYDHLIMLDDDCQLVGSKEDAKKYMEQIDKNNKSFGVFKGTLLKLFAIPKFIMQQVDYEDIEAEKGEGFEDMVFVETCKKKFPYNFFIFNRYGLDERSNSSNDKESTWWRGQYVKKEMGDRSRKIIKDFKG